jgi:hypothetical protein
LESISLSAVLQFLICVGIVWLGRTSVRNSEALVRVETILTGGSKDTGILSEVAQLRVRAHDLADAIHVVQGKQELLQQRFDQLSGAS